MWTIEEAQIFLKELMPRLTECGYTAEIVGSVAKEGRSNHDLDILLTPTREDYDFEPLYDELNGEFMMHPETGLSEIYCFAAEKYKIVDFFFQEGINSL
jgi:hypothetical protein